MGTITDFITEGIIGVSLRPKRYDIELYQGDTFEATLVFRDVNLAPIDLTGIELDCRLTPVSPNTSPQPPSPVAIAGPNIGEVTLLIVDTKTLSGNYTWDLQLVNGTRKRTYIGGLVTITTDLTVTP